MRVLAGGPARETESEMFRLHVEGLEAQDTDDLSLTIRHEVVPDDGGPRWHHSKIERVARVRQRFLRECRKGVDELVSRNDDGTVTVRRRTAEEMLEDCDALLMVDTDVILGPGVLERMWAVDADVVFGVFWTKADWGNAPGIDTWPQVWSRHPYRFDAETWDALVAPGVNEVPVLGGGACTLIRGRGFESRYWPLLESLSAYEDMMCGEDRSFCLGLEARGIRMVAVTGLPIIHLHEARLQTPEMVAEARERLFGGVLN